MIINKIQKLIRQIRRTVEDIYYSHTIIVDNKRCVIDRRIKNIDIEGEEINIGEKAVIYRKQWVKIVNEFPIKYSYKERRDNFEKEYIDEFLALNSRTICAGDSCIIAMYGEIKVLGFVDNGNGDEDICILVSYSSIGYHYETCCPSNAEFLLKPKEFIKLRETSQNSSRPPNFWRK